MRKREILNSAWKIPWLGTLTETRLGASLAKKILFFWVFLFISLPSVPKIILRKDPFADHKFTMWPLPSVAFGKGFTECIWAFAKSHSQRSLEFCTKNTMTWDFDKDQVRGLKFLFFKVFSFISLSSVPKITLGKDPFSDQKFTIWPLPSVALGKGFTECIWAFAECHRHSTKHPCPVVVDMFLRVSIHIDLAKMNSAAEIQRNHQGA